MRIAGRITGEALLIGGEMVKPGISTKDIDNAIRRHIEKCGAKPSFLGYGGFPASACISVNNEVIHGIPSHDRILEEGDIVKIDVGAFIGGVHGDSANTIPVGKISDEAAKLIEVTKTSFERAVEVLRSNPNPRLGDLGAAIDGYVVANGCSTVKKYVGHGIGENLHEDPNVPNFGTAGRGARICRGMVIAVEPMVNAGRPEVSELPDHWTVVTKDRKPAAHYENTILITDGEPEILSKTHD
jgi:methionyl aminopeptidase